MVLLRKYDCIQIKEIEFWEKLIQLKILLKSGVLHLRCAKELITELKDVETETKAKSFPIRNTWIISTN